MAVTEPSGSITAAGLHAIDTASMDIETALLAVQGKRAELLESQLRDQIAAVQAKNQQIGKLNEVLSALTGSLSAYGTEANGEYQASKAPANFSSEQLNQTIADSGISDMGWSVTITHESPGPVLNVGGGCLGSAIYAELSHIKWDPSLKRNDIDGAITKVKGQIDSLANSQQMDTLRLQSLSAKRNEAFEQMTNWIKKMQDVRNNMLGNMR